MQRVLAAVFAAVMGLGGVQAQPDGLREACRRFVERAEAARPIDWGQYWLWTVVANEVGTHSVGARYVASGMPRYVVCVLRLRAGAFELQQLTRWR